MIFKGPGALLSLLLSTALFADIQDVPIEYKITPAKGHLHSTVDGKTAYKHWSRGSFDKEHMVEIWPKKIVQEFVQPDIIPAPKPKQDKSGYVSDKPPLKGEDKVFVKIGEDEIKDRCLILGEGCDLLIKPPEDQDSIYYKAMDKAKEKLSQAKQIEKNRKIIQP